MKAYTAYMLSASPTLQWNIHFKMGMNTLDQTILEGWEWGCGR